MTGERKGAEKAGGEKKGAEKAATTKSPPAPATGTETKPAVKGADTTSTRKRSAGRAEPSGEPAPKRKAAKALGKQASVPPVPGAVAELDSRAAGSAAADLDSPAERGEGGGVPGTAPLTGPSGAGVPTPKPASSVEALARTVFVGNLPPGTNRKAVRRLLAPCGAVQSVRLRSLAVKQDVKMPRRSAVRAGEIDQARGSGHAYVVFAGAAAVDKALALNMTEVGAWFGRGPGGGLVLGWGTGENRGVALPGTADDRATESGHDLPPCRHGSRHTRPPRPEPKAFLPPFPGTARGPAPARGPSGGRPGHSRKARRSAQRRRRGRRVRAQPVRVPGQPGAQRGGALVHGPGR